MKKNWQGYSLTWGKRLTMVVIILIALGYGVLAMAQRSPEALRMGLQDALSRASGHNGEITTLQEARLVPDAYFKVAGINIRDEKDADKNYVHADSAVISTPFWRVMLGMTAFKALEVNNLQTATGYILPKKLEISFGGISDHDPQNAPQLLLEGRYNDLPLLATMEMLRKETRSGFLYVFSDASMVTFKLGETEMEGMVMRHFTDMALESARIERGDLSVDFTARDIHTRPLNVKIKGNISGAPFNALLTGEGENTVLTITPETTDAAHLEIIQKFVDAVSGDLGLKDINNRFRIDIAGQPNETNPAEPAKENEDK